ncbi:IclR family transcriptional regulator [Nocardia australiensis]|uniref:IclR family transcriptional regulator n=1 Tax=Nocardia australiensis TaxID=2887191 RepID=UPI001D14ADB8|nr:helix-turn-helix domain-containing protein [Nocardia australiensis]
MPTDASSSQGKGSAVDKALDIVEAVATADGPLRLIDLANLVGLHRATAYKVVLDLVRRGWVLRDGDHYLPGTALLHLSFAAGVNALLVLSRPVLQSLADRTSMMVNLQILTIDRARIIDVVRPPRLQSIVDRHGQLLRVDESAGALALVAALDDIAATPYLRMAETSSRESEHGTELRRRIEAARKAGFAEQRGSATVIADVGRAVLAPGGRPTCALTVVSLASEFDEVTMSKVEAELMTATQELERILNGATRGAVENQP